MVETVAFSFESHSGYTVTYFLHSSLLWTISGAKSSTAFLLQFLQRLIEGLLQGLIFLRRRLLG